jgi:cell division septum initiation protein DivIVA
MQESWRIPVSTFLVINEDELVDLVDQMRTAIPREVRQAERTIQEQDRIIAAAEDEASRIVQVAQEEAAQLAEEHAIIEAANQRAQTIIERAQREAEALKIEADEYAKEVLISLDSQLGVVDGQIATLLATVRNGLDTLAGAPEPEITE